MALIDGKSIAAQRRTLLRERVVQLRARGVTPGLAVILVGNDPASRVYVRNKTTACTEVGIANFQHDLPPTTSQAELLTLIDALNHDPQVHGILVQQPLPRSLDSQAVIDAIAPHKDADGFHPVNVGRLALDLPAPRPCTPLGVMELIRTTGIALAGAEAVVIGRSRIVGRPMALMLTAADATVTVCHSKTRDLPGHVRRADLLVAALGRPGFVRPEWIKPGAIVIDVGISRAPDGTLAGDVDPAAAGIASWMTPVPGGVGPMTIAMLLENTVALAK